MTQKLSKSATETLLCEVFEQAGKELDLPFEPPFCDRSTGEYMSSVRLHMPIEVTPAELFNMTPDNMPELLRKKVRKGLIAGLERIVETLGKIEE